MTRLAACVALACGPLAAALLTEGRWVGEDSRVFFLVAFGLALAILAVLALHRADARRGREAEARERSLRQARDQQAATAEILGAIAASPPDLQRVLDTIARNAARVCDGLYAQVYRFDGKEIRLAAHHGLSPARLEALNRQFPRGLDEESVSARAIRDASVVHCPDVLIDPRFPTWAREIARAEGFRSVVVVPMLREGRALGTLNVSRPEGGFTDRQIQLLRSFADQALIAIENVRLFQELQARNRELSEALEQQTATAEILRVISSSPTDLAPVMDAVTRNATRLARADHALIGEAAEGRIRWLAASGCLLASEGPPISRQLPSGRAILDCQTTQVEDVTELTEDFPGVRRAHDEFGVRTILATPLMREGLAIGVLLVRRTEVRPFAGKEIEVLRTFADQAVIAIENVRLFQELQARNRQLTEALEQQTATGAILRVMSGSPTDIQPVLDAVAESATRLCDAKDVTIALVDQDVLRVMASHGMLARWWPDAGVPIGRGSVTGRAVVDRRAVHIHDLASESDEEFPQGKVYQRIGGHRTNLAVPLLREGVAIGVIAMRRGEVRPFSEKQVTLLETFADQAVIAIENVRLFKELEVRNRALTEALERETATGAILRVISSSPTDVQPVFDAIVRSAVRLCGAFNGVLFRLEDGLLDVAAYSGTTTRDWADVLRAGFPKPPARDLVGGVALLDRVVVHIPDIGQDDRFPRARELARMMGYRSILFVPMLRDEDPIGTIGLNGHTPFSDGQIELLRTFAAQAVIAIENVRLFQELQARNRDLTEALEQQTATAEILRVISRSPGDVHPVFDAILDSAIRLCGAAVGGVYRLEGGLIHVAAMRNPAPGMVEAMARYYPRPPEAEGHVARAVRERQVVHVADVLADPAQGIAPRELARVGQFRSQLTVPLLRDGSAVGAIAVGRAEPGRFPNAQVTLLRTFADQAVIALENARLFQERETRNRELTESLEQQTTTAEILRVISRSPTDTQPVFDAIVESAVRLCDARSGSLYRIEDGVIHQVGYLHPSEEAHAAYRAAYPRPVDQADPAVRRLFAEAATVHLADVETEPGLTEEFRGRSRTSGYRSVVAVPMLREGQVIGTMAVARAGPDRTPRPFSDREIGLLQTFAAQAVIAIENVRLFQELEARNRDLTEALERETATGGILRAIAMSPTDSAPVFEAILESALGLCRASIGAVLQSDGQLVSVAATRGRAAMAEVMRATYPRRVEDTGLAVRAIRECVTVHVADVLQEPTSLHSVDEPGEIRAQLSVPMLREGRCIGAIIVCRPERELFSEPQVALVRTLADQAVIAIENVRLFQELQQRNRELTESLEQQTATAEILRVISSSPTDVQPVFETIVESVVRLCDGVFTTVFRFDGELIHPVAYHRSIGPEGLEVHQRMYPRAPSRDSVVARAILDRAVVHVPDVESDPDLPPATRQLARVVGYQSIPACPCCGKGVLSAPSE